LSGGIVLVGRDGVMRDIAGVHGSPWARGFQSWTSCNARSPKRIWEQSPKLHRLPAFLFSLCKL
jgi:hypothetical protein